MRLVWLTATLAAALSSVADAALRSAPNASPTPARVVPVTEETAAPGVSDNYYEPCIYLDLTAWSNSIAAESDECAIKTSYVWNGLYLPTATERRELCSCTLLINKLQTVVVPRCSLVRDGGTISYAKLIEYAFGLCSVDGQSAPTSPSTNDNDSNETDTTPTKSKSKAPLIGGIAGGVAVIIIAIAAFFCCRKRKEASEEKSEEATQAHGAVEALPLSPLGDENSTAFSVVPKTPPTDPRSSEYVKSGGSKSHSSQRSTMSVGTYGTRVAQSETGMWDDPVLTAVRIPYDSIFFGALISRGGYGEVYKGTYKGETVAIKQLLPDRRKDLVQIDAFMSEVKLLSTLEHERIVRFIGIAWNSLSDVCAVVEYMPNGDLRSTLNTWEYEHARPHGFDADKAKIALHIAHALTYLHSCQPVIVHRDLKSKNILLNEAYDAKLTDFGVSRERGDSTMTAGVGTSLWMAPEVMMGQRYDEKADVFSFGIVLAELDTHELPYSHAMDSVTGRKIVDSAILQMVSLGRLTIQFSKQAHEEIAQLGKECVALDPKERPSTGQVLHRVHQVWRELSR